MGSSKFQSRNYNNFVLKLLLCKGIVATKVNKLLKKLERNFTLLWLQTLKNATSQGKKPYFYLFHVCIQKIKIFILVLTGLILVYSRLEKEISLPDVYELVRKPKACLS
jgi:hypothetical protein